MIVASPADGRPIALNNSAALVWMRLVDWTSIAGLEQTFAEMYPAIDADQRGTGLSDAIVALEREGLLERRAT